MNPEEQIAALQAIIDGEPLRTAEAVASATADLAATIDQRAEYAAGLETQLSATQDQVAALQADLSAAESARAAAVAELAQYKPLAGSIITIVDFQRRLIPARFRLPTLDPVVQAGWKAVFNEVMTTFTQVYLTDPQLTALLDKAVADGVLSQDEADAVQAY